MTHHLITLMILLPFVGALLQAALPSGDSKSAQTGKWVALSASVLASLCGLFVVASMQTQTPDLQMTETLPWVGSYAIGYEMGVDGLNALMVILISVLFPILIAAEWEQELGVRGMHGLFLLLQAAFFGAVCAQDLFLQFFFWGFSALPFYFLIGVWGGEQRESAAFRSMIAAAIGNALLFAALILIYYSVDPHTFSIHELSGGRLAGKTFEFMGVELSVSGASFALIAFGLALRTPVWPLHGWFTRVAEEAPPTVLVALASATIPVSTYLFIRLTYSLFPGTLVAVAKFIVLVGVINLLIGGICAAAQKGLRSLLSFVSLSQVGLILIGVGSLSQSGLVGAVYQQLVLGLGLAGFGLISGLIIHRAGHASFILDQDERPFGGVAIKAPAVAVVAGVVIASLLGLPGFGGFVGNSLVIIGSYTIQPAAVMVTGVALMLAAYYFLTMYRLVFLGKPGAAAQQFADLNLRERAYLLPLVIGLLAFGLYPRPFLDLVRPTVLTLLSSVK